MVVVVIVKGSNHSSSSSSINSINRAVARPCYTGQWLDLAWSHAWSRSRMEK